MLTRRSLTAMALLAPGGVLAQGLAKVRIGQATPALSFLPLMAARALGSFAGVGLALEWAAIPGGDPAALAALDGGDLDLAAVGSETVLAAIGKGLPYQIVASLMSKVSLQLVVSTAFLKRTGVSSDDPLPARLAALKGCLVGVSAIGGTQDRAARWLAAQAGLDPRTGVQVANVGAPVAIQAALENARIEAFVLSPPEGQIAEEAGAGRIFIRMGEAFPALRGVPSLVLVAKTPVAQPALVTKATHALRAASAQVLADTAGSAAAIQRALFARARSELIAAAVESLKDGVAGGGRMDQEAMAALLAYAGDGGAGIRGLDPSPGVFWTNAFIDAPG